jgi:hypothetical protein
MDAYRALVDAAAGAEDGRIVLNRTSEHASIIMEYLFRKAHDRVEIVTGRLTDSTYGTDETIKAALTFLAGNPDAAIDILAEREIALDNKLMTAVRDAGFAERVVVTHVPATIQASYQDHVIISDGVHYRYQKNRGDCAATVQFGSNGAVGKLREDFLKLKERARLAA